MARGKTNAEVAAILFVAPGTVKKHLDHIYGKLAVSSRTAAAAVALTARADGARRLGDGSSARASDALE